MGIGGEVMFKRLIQVILALVGGTVGYFLGPPFFLWANTLFNFGMMPAPEYVGAGVGALLMLLFNHWLIRHVLRWLKRGEESLVKIPAVDLMFGGLGLIVGLLVAFLMVLSVSSIPILGQVLPILLTVILGYLGFRVGYKKRDEIVGLFSSSKAIREAARETREKGRKEQTPRFEHKILDTSVIIDGRIADICRTGFLEGTLVIPSFVLEELRHIADSSDILKRNRGRRGLDILNQIQKELHVRVLIYEKDFDDIQEVDSKLIKLAKLLNGKVVTNDFNLNKVCELQGVPVLNINDLANAVKPVVLPGEELTVQVIKDGKEHGQGVAYLDDGTMIVVEGGKDYIGNHIDVLVTSVLQTSAGRMIFAKPKVLERVL
jgi:uncharacterized protein YacL